MRAKPRQSPPVASGLEVQLGAYAEALRAYVGLPDPAPRVVVVRAPSRASGSACYRPDTGLIEFFRPPDTNDGTRRALAHRGAAGVTEALAEALVDHWQHQHGTPGSRPQYRTREWLKHAQAVGLALDTHGNVAGLGPNLLRWLRDGDGECPSLETLLSVATHRQQSRLQRLTCRCPGAVYASKNVNLLCRTCDRIFR